MIQEEPKAKFSQWIDVSELLPTGFYTVARHLRVNWSHCTSAPEAWSRGSTAKLNILNEKRSRHLSLACSWGRKKTRLLLALHCMDTWDKSNLVCQVKVCHRANGLTVALRQTSTPLKMNLLPFTVICFGQKWLVNVWIRGREGKIVCQSVWVFQVTHLTDVKECVIAHQWQHFTTINIHLLGFTLFLLYDCLCFIADATST